MYLKILNNEYCITRNNYIRLGFSKAKNTTLGGAFGIHWALYLIFIVIIKWRGKCI